MDGARSFLAGSSATEVERIYRYLRKILEIFAFFQHEE